MKNSLIRSLDAKPGLIRTLGLRINRLFLLTIVVPTVLAGVYYGLISSDIYISESRFVVRSPEQKTAPPSLGSLLKGTGSSPSQDDASTVHDFMLSRDALKQLDVKLGVRKSFSSDRVDRINRFGGIDWDTSFEALHRYYQKMAEVNIDSSTSIAVLRVKAFTAEDAYRINVMLLEMGEDLVNKLSERARHDLIGFAAAEVAQAEAMVKNSALALSQYRTSKGVFDPPRQSHSQLEQITKLQVDLISNKTQLAQLRSFSKDNPQIPVLQKQIEALQAEIDGETSKVIGAERSLAKKAPEYERLALDQSFADKQLTTALASLEKARYEAMRQQLYLERIVQPNKPDVAVEPRPLRLLLTTLGLGLVAWGILSILIAGVREHYG